jgi:outer membrane protein assembly factor BamB
MFRGGPQLTGVAASELPDKPALLWKFNAGDSVASSAAIDGGVVYVGCENGNLYALNLANGSIRWQTQTAPTTQTSSTQPSRPAIQSSPTVHKDLILFGDMDGFMHAVAKSDGKEKWTYHAGGEVISSANCWEDRVLFGSYDGSLYCVSDKDGKEIWKYETEGKVHATPGIWLDSKHVAHAIIAGCDAHMRIIRISDGRQVSAVEIGGYCGASPAIVENRAYVGNFSNQVCGVDLTAAKLLWTYEDSERQFPYLSSAAVAPGHVVLGGRDKVIHCLDPMSGKTQWAFTTRGRVDSSPVINGNRVWAASSDGNLYSLDLVSGKELWRYEVASPMSASPAIADGRLVIGTEDGAIFCFGAAEARK